VATPAPHASARRLVTSLRVVPMPAPILSRVSVP